MRKFKSFIVLNTARYEKVEFLRANIGKNVIVKHNEFPAVGYLIGTLGGCNLPENYYAPRELG